MKQKEYRKAIIDLCRNCYGSGTVDVDQFDKGEFIGRKTGKCPVCEGAGRVWKVNAGTVTIEPYTGQK